MLPQQLDAIQPESKETYIKESVTNWEPVVVLASLLQSWSWLQRIQKETLLQQVR